MRPFPNPLRLLSFTVVISIHLLEDFVRPFLRGGFVFRHVHHRGDHFVDGLGGEEGVRAPGIAHPGQGLSSGLCFPGNGAGV